MFNLLPEADKKNVLKEYSMRRAVVILLFLLVAGLIALVTALPSKLLSSSKFKGVQKQIEVSKTIAILNEEAKLTSSLSLVNSKLTALKDAGGSSIVDLIERIIVKKGQSIKIRGISYIRNVDKSTISLSGVTQNRESLLNFVKSLKTEPLWSEVNLPVSNFAKEKDAEFTIEIKGKF